MLPRALKVGYSQSPSFHSGIEMIIRSFTLNLRKPKLRDYIYSKAPSCPKILRTVWGHWISSPKNAINRILFLIFHHGLKLTKSLIGFIWVIVFRCLIGGLAVTLIRGNVRVEFWLPYDVISVQSLKHLHGLVFAGLVIGKIVTLKIRGAYFGRFT